MMFSSMLLMLNSSSPRCESFTRFNDLPPELRNKIWLHSLPCARIVLLEQYDLPTDNSTENCPQEATSDHHSDQRDAAPSQPRVVDSSKILSSPTPTPAMFSACQESRSFIKSFYTNVFASERSYGVWFRIEKDVLYFSQTTYKEAEALFLQFTDDMKRIQDLAVGGKYVSSDDYRRMEQLTPPDGRGLTRFLPWRNIIWVEARLNSGSCAGELAMDLEGPLPEAVVTELIRRKPYMCRDHFRFGILKRRGADNGTAEDRRLLIKCFFSLCRIGCLLLLFFWMGARG